MMLADGSSPYDLELRWLDGLGVAVVALKTLDATHDWSWHRRFDFQCIRPCRRTTHVLDVTPIGAREDPLPIRLNRTTDCEMSGTVAAVYDPIDRELVATRNSIPWGKERFQPTDWPTQKNWLR